MSTATSASSLDLLDTVLDGVLLLLLTRVTSVVVDFRGEEMFFRVTSVIRGFDSDLLFSLSTDFFGDETGCFGVSSIPNALLLILFLSSKPC